MEQTLTGNLGERPWVIIADTGALMGEVFQGLKEGPERPKLLSLLFALDRESAILLIPRHVFDEVRRNLPRRAPSIEVAEVGRERLETLYLSRARVVDVPDEWGAADPRVVAVAGRHRADLPLARLAVAVAPCQVLAEDPDLTASGFGTAKWLPITFAVAADAEFAAMTFVAALPVGLGAEATMAGVRWLGKASNFERIVVVALVPAVAVWMWKSGRGAEVYRRAGSAIGAVASIAGPPVAEVLERRDKGQRVLATKAVRQVVLPGFSERVAAILARAPVPLLAREIARTLGGPGGVEARSRAVREELRRCGAFVEVSRGRWQLGYDTGYERADVPQREFGDFLVRSHRGTLSQRITAESGVLGSRLSDAPRGPSVSGRGSR
ncbi:MAG: PIN domain-containing protein [Mycobacteriales bacterium]